MDTQTTFPEDLYEVKLFDGLTVLREGKPIKYKLVKLRDILCEDEQRATQLAERVVFVQGQPKLLVSDAVFRFAMTMMHIESMHCDSLVLERSVIDLTTLGKLTPHDIGLIEARVFLITLAAEVRYGNMSMEAFEQAWRGDSQPTASPQPVGQAADSGAGAAGVESGPQVLSDFSGKDAAGTPAGDAA